MSLPYPVSFEESIALRRPERNRCRSKLKIRLMERMLGAELTAHLGYEEGKEAPWGQGNRRNGTSTKVLKGRDGEMPLAVPRDRDSSFGSGLVKKGQTGIDGMDDKSSPCRPPLVRGPWRTDSMLPG
ncbi:transposase [Paracoccus rhizosphaerae]|uniref:transposase n=1 Tax=Paracoccus rhizosphaerae TaxID=1133347 RepID=UPI003608D1E9